MSRRRKKIAKRKRLKKEQERRVRESLEREEQKASLEQGKKEQRSLVKRFSGEEGIITVSHGSSPFNIGLKAEGFELISQKDGLFRGLVEPVVVAGLYSVDINAQGALGKTRFLARYHFKYVVREKSPTVAWSVQDDAQFPKPNYLQNTALVFIFAACEENNGKSIIELLNSLDDPSKLLVCEKDRNVSVPDVLDSIIADNDEKTTTPIDLFVEGQNVEKDFSSDSLIASAALWWIPQVSQTHQIVCPFKEESKKNRWQGTWTCQLISRK